MFSAVRLAGGAGYVGGESAEKSSDLKITSVQCFAAAEPSTRRCTQAGALWPEPSREVYLTQRIWFLG